MGSRCASIRKRVGTNIAKRRSSVGTVRSPTEATKFSFFSRPAFCSHRTDTVLVAFLHCEVHPNYLRYVNGPRQREADLRTYYCRVCSQISKVSLMKTCNCIWNSGRLLVSKISLSEEHQVPERCKGSPFSQHPLISSGCRQAFCFL
jgi:hypothetical protein